METFHLISYFTGNSILKNVLMLMQKRGLQWYETQ
jgi:hypothetical protein